MKHRIAILSDIHGNTTALEAVIKDAQELGATEYWLMGDILLPGPGRNELFELLSSIPITATVRGNWDGIWSRGPSRNSAPETYPVFDGRTRF